MKIDHYFGSTPGNKSEFIDCILQERKTECVMFISGQNIDFVLHSNGAVAFPWHGKNFILLFMLNIVMCRSAHNLGTHILQNLISKWFTHKLFPTVMPIKIL